MATSLYLSLSRHGIYYFRWPLDQLRSKGRTHLRISLRTRCPDEARELAQHLACCGRLMRENGTLARLRQDEIRTKVSAFFEAQLEQYKGWLDRHGLSKNALMLAEEEMLDHDASVGLEAAHPSYLPIARFKRKMDVSDQDWDDSCPRIVIELRKGRRDLLRAVLEAAERLNSYPLGGEAKNVLPALSDELRVSSPIGPTIDEFVAEHSKQWADKTILQNKAYLAILVEFFGAERELASITKKDANAVKQVLLNLPSSRNTKPALKKLPLSEVVKVKTEKTISPKTINSYLQMFQSFWDWAERHGHTTTKLFVGMKVAKEKKPERERMALSHSQTTLILDGLTTRDKSRHAKDSHKWGTLLGLFTGARLNEICQLQIQDVQEDEGIPYLNITDDGDSTKRLKSDASKRLVPIHSRLIELGFLQFVEERKNSNRLFPDYSFSRNGGYGRNLGRWCNESFLPKLNIKTPGLVFHSFRHTMVTRLGQADVPEPVIQCLVGHARSGVTQEVYFKEGFKLPQLKEAIDKFQA